MKEAKELLYQKIKETLQEASDQTGMAIEYEFSASFFLDNGKKNPMVRWASSKGQDIFGWKDSRKMDWKNKCVFYKTNFYPE